MKKILKLGLHILSIYIKVICKTQPCLSRFEKSQKAILRTLWIQCLYAFERPYVCVCICICRYICIYICIMYMYHYIYIMVIKFMVLKLGCLGLISSAWPWASQIPLLGLSDCFLTWRVIIRFLWRLNQCVNEQMIVCNRFRMVPMVNAM